jgi:DNA-binding transcriptional MocR family regulator
MVTMFKKLAAMIETSVECGSHLPGEKIASVRQCAQQQKLSITTVLRAYLLLESKGIIESRPQSGYFVRAQVRKLKEIPSKTVKPAPVSAEVDVGRLVISTLRSIGVDAAVPLGSPYPDLSHFPLLRLNQHSNAISRRHPHWSLMDDLPPGNRELIRQIARRYLESAFPVDPGEIIITVGATEAINLCLQAVAKPGVTDELRHPSCNRADGNAGDRG